MNKELRPEYKQELIDLESKMIEAQNFADKFPAFSEHILKNKFTKDFKGRIADSYKGLYCGWGINRYLYTDKKKYH